MNKAVKGSALIASLALLLGGCATVSEAELETIRSDIRAAQGTADQALSEAQAARSAADSASREAASAQATANDARSIAQDAKAATEATDARIDQMFKKAMMK